MDKTKILEAINFLKKDGAFDKAKKIENDPSMTSDEKVNALFLLALEEALNHDLIVFTKKALEKEE